MFVSSWVNISSFYLVDSSPSMVSHLSHPLVLKLCAGASWGCPAGQKKTNQRWEELSVASCFWLLAVPFHWTKNRKGGVKKLSQASPPSSVTCYCSGNYSLPFSYWNSYEGWHQGTKMFLSSVWLVVNPLRSVKDGWFLDSACL